MTNEVNMRRTPRQARSQQRVDHLLDTAAAVFNEIGYEAATTNMIAKRADVPIGSLYQFFPNKESILEALAARYVEGMREVGQTYMNVEATRDLPMREMLERLVGAISTFEQTHAAFRPVFMSSHITSAQALHQEMIQSVDDLIGARFPALNAERRRLAAMTGVAIVKGLMMLSAPPDNLPPPQVGTEIVTALLAYLRAVMVSEGLPLPADLV